MATEYVHKCDRCKKKMDVMNICGIRVCKRLCARVVVNTDSDGKWQTPEDYELCKECRKKLGKFLKGEE